jgi:dinuclear metal center YbgI/SA1388 family protein
LTNSREDDLLARLNSIVRFLNKELQVRKIKDFSKNGLQVRASNEISKVGLSVDAWMDVFKKAKKLKCDLLIAHHGMLWKKPKELAHTIKKKTVYLKKNKISLYGVHLPLDKHKKYGNSVLLFKLLNAKPKELFGEVGYLGYFEKPRSIDSIAEELDRKLKTRCMVWRFGKSNIKKIAIVSGGGKDYLPEAIRKNVDLFITGEVSHGTFRIASDSKISVIAAGHYKTETVGVKALGLLLNKKFKLKTVFIDSPTGL